MEKRLPTYDLKSIQLAFSEPEKLSATYSSIRDARALGYDAQDMVDVIHSIERKHFVKSMTSHADYKVWQDAYNVPWDERLLYIKFTIGKVTDFYLLSFKEK
jgi:motility quorum-sensing regulator/GCU-specific mRNA interferase toxin